MALFKYVCMYIAGSVNYIPARAIAVSRAASSVEISKGRSSTAPDPPASGSFGTERLDNVVVLVGCKSMIH